MAAPRSRKADLVSVTVLVGGNKIHDTYEIAEIRVQRQINRIPQAKIVLLDGSASAETFKISESQTFLPGNEIEIKAGYRGEDSTLFKGIIIKHGLKIGGGQSYLVVSCFDKALKMTVGRKNSFFVEKSDSEIIEELIKASALSAQVESTHPIHKMLIRYYATDWDFMLARAEASGQIVWVEEGKVIVKTPNFDTDSGIVIRYGDTLQALNAEIDAKTQFASVACNAWDFSAQTLLTEHSTEPAASASGNLNGKKLAEVLGLAEFALQTAAPLTQAELKAWADAQLLKSRLSRLRGAVSILGNAKAMPGRTVDLEGLGARFNGKAFISGVIHQIKQGEWESKIELGLSPRWFVEEQPDVEAPAAAGLAPGIHGLMIGKVKQIDQDPDGQTRVLVDVPLIKPNGEGVWARLASGYATENAGLFFIPEVGDEVVLGFLNDDPAFPILLGSLYSGVRTPPYTPDDHNTNKAIVSKAQVKIAINDQKKQIQISTPGGHIITLNDEDQTITVLDSNRNTIKMSSNGMTMESPANITVKADGQIDIQAQGGIRMESSVSVDIEAPEVNAKASVALSAQGQGSAQLTSSGEVTVRGALVMIN